MAMKAAAKRKTNKTVLIVGEGDTEKAFLDRLKALYVTRDCGVSAKVLNAHGGSPEYIVEFSIRQIKQADYELVAVLMDTDVPWPQQVRTIANSKKIVLIGAQPCCDGLLLEVLGQPVPAESERCKEALTKLLGGKATSPDLLTRHLSKEVLERRRAHVAVLDDLLTILAGVRPERS